MDAAAQRYTAVAILLHWAIAAAILANIAIGWWMHGAIDAPASQARAVDAFQLHKSIGLTILLLSLLRLGWRLAHPPPALPGHMPTWERLAAKTTHWLFYGLMLAIPLTGWLYVSTQWRGNAALQVPTLWFGLFEIPHLFALNDATAGLRQSLSGLLFDVHQALAWSFAGLLVMHVAAALKHHFRDHDQVLARMVPALEEKTLAPAGSLRKWTLRGGMLLIAIAVGALLVTLLKSPGASTGADTAITHTPGSWVVDAENSAIRFSGTHAGAEFNGRFTRWNTDIRIDTQAPARSQVSATIETASAEDGVPLHNKTLPQQEWFNSEVFPQARFQATTITQAGAQRFQIQGVLTIKDNKIPVDALFLELKDNTATITGEFVVDRKAANLGMESDPSGQWVSREIAVDVRAVLHPPP